MLTGALLDMFGHSAGIIIYIPIILKEIFLAIWLIVKGEREEAKILIEQWRKEYNQVRPHSAKNYRPPAPETILTMVTT